EGKVSANNWSGEARALAQAQVAGSIGPRRKPLGAAVVGCGYWGPNLARNLSETPEFRLHALCDRDPSVLRALQRKYPDALALGDFDQVLGDDAVDAVVIATPPTTHAPLAKRALLAGKHVLVEKPLATSLEDGLELAELARSSGLTLMPGHTFIYSPAVNTVAQLIREEVVGEIHFITSSRMNLGKYGRDGVVCDLAPHDLSILLYWLRDSVVEVAALGSCVFKEGVPETAFMTLTFASGTTANVQLSWLAPRKVRQMIVVGSKRMVQYDDTAADEPVRVYDRGMDVGAPSNFGEHQLIYRSGDVVIPRVEAHEPLRLELEDFARAIRTGEEPRSNLAIGLDIVAAVEVAGMSMSLGGVPQACAQRPEQAAA
ncbi:MAG TPA: Gfo/Idh/MocA family oxidoreductase, partial [Solirubrobacteraceae bacterium]|nr:Gfo/Idh/MocA family oxidoreductase [Solirubrobacteraceae bacterium]